jgi:tRNA-2-methylthio-N6-dimethylallyladenosine synthase
MPDSIDNRTYHLTTFGCQMNDHDSERIRGVLESDGWEQAASQEGADLLVFNTCAVRESAESRLLGRLGEASRLKKENPQIIVAIAGCFAQSKGETIFRELPFVDVAFGPQNIAELPSLVARSVEKWKSGGAGHAGAFGESAASSGSLPSARSGGYHAWLQVMTGCTNFCSYCIVPFVRGPEQSRAASDILAEAESLARSGVKEITLLGQNVNAYGLDLPAGAKREDFAGLLAMIDAVPGIERIRFTTSHPRDLNDAIVGAMRDLPHVCEHLHLPVQSGSSRILARMKRGYSRDLYSGLIEKLYAEIPGISLTTDVIVGFPGEKEDDFHRTMTLAESCRFDGAFTFRFSPRSGTEASSLAGVVPEGTIRRRMRELVALTQEIALSKNRGLVGTLQEVMVEGESRQGGGQVRGRTRTNKIVNFEVGSAGPAEANRKTPAKSPLKLDPGRIVTVKIESATSTTLKGTGLTYLANGEQK